VMKKPMGWGGAFGACALVIPRYPSEHRVTMPRTYCLLLILILLIQSLKSSCPAFSGLHSSSGGSTLLSPSLVCLAEILLQQGGGMVAGVEPGRARIERDA